MIVKILAPDSSITGKLADAEVHFTSGPFTGLKLVGFGIWERRAHGGRNVTFPAKSFSVNGERRSFALLRPATPEASTDALRNLILDAYAKYEEQVTEGGGR